MNSTDPDPEKPKEEAARACAGPRTILAILLRQVGDAEVLARRCNIKHATPGKPVKFQAFLATKWPLEISVDRAACCNPWDKIDDKKKWGIAFALAGAIRRTVAKAKVVCSQPPPEHAHVEVWHEGLPPNTHENKRSVEQDANLWSAHVQVCEELAKVSNALAPYATSERTFRKIQEGLSKLVGARSPS